LRVKRKGELEYFVGRRYGDFARLYKRLRTELPGKVLPPLPKKNKSNSTASNLLGGIPGNGESEVSSVSSASTQVTLANGSGDPSRMLAVKGHVRSSSAASSRASPIPSTDRRPLSPALPSPENGDIVLWRESQRISLRAFLRALLHNPQIAQTKAMEDFLTKDPVTPSDKDVEDIIRRKHVDEKRMEEQKQFYEIARKRAAELDVYMEEYVRVS
jgi:hypothetical protein